jgi:hypothetical protein
MAASETAMNFQRCLVRRSQHFREFWPEDPTKLSFRGVRLCL